MKNKLFSDIIQDIIDNNTDKCEIEINITDWKECGEYAGEDPRPIFSVKIKNPNHF